MLSKKQAVFCVFFGYGMIIVANLIQDISSGVISIGDYYSGHYEALPAFLCSCGLFWFFMNADMPYSKLTASISASSYKRH